MFDQVEPYFANAFCEIAHQRQITPETLIDLLLIAWPHIPLDEAIRVFCLSYYRTSYRKQLVAAGRSLQTTPRKT